MKGVELHHLFEISEVLLKSYTTSAVSALASCIHSHARERNLILSDAPDRLEGTYSMRGNTVHVSSLYPHRNESAIRPAKSPIEQVRTFASGRRLKLSKGFVRRSLRGLTAVGRNHGTSMIESRKSGDWSTEGNIGTTGQQEAAPCGHATRRLCRRWAPGTGWGGGGAMPESGGTSPPPSPGTTAPCSAAGWSAYQADHCALLPVHYNSSILVSRENKNVLWA